MSNILVTFLIDPRFMGNNVNKVKYSQQLQTVANILKSQEVLTEQGSFQWGFKYALTKERFKVCKMSFAIFKTKLMVSVNKYASLNLNDKYIICCFFVVNLLLF